MSLNSIEAGENLFTDYLAKKASLLPGESESAISKAVSGIIPSLSGGLIIKTTVQRVPSLLRKW